MNCDHLDKFEEKHVISILMYVAGNPGCKKTDIYDAVSRNPRMPEKNQAEVDKRWEKLIKLSKL